MNSLKEFYLINLLDTRIFYKKIYLKDIFKRIYLKNLFK